MIFTSPEFLVFALIFFGLWFALPRLFGVGSRRPLLLIASYLFYGSWNAKFLLLIFGSTLLDFWVGGRLAQTEDAQRRKRLLMLSLAGNLGALGFFKYYGFFVDSAVAGLAALGLTVSPPTLHVVLPVGISFYTFQTLSYTIDVYRRELPAAKRFVDFALYVTFFPQLVAGPIERATRLLPQMANLNLPPRWSGLGLIAWGAFKKAALADNFAQIVELTYADPQLSYAPALWIGSWAFAFQIYCDFSGYSDMAIGLARLLGLELMQNFKAPYASCGPSEFWRRWHISLSSWLRDYLYIPLGGNRHGPWRTQRNLMLTMLLGGLWHGAAWNFVLWGAWQGLLLAAFRPRFWRRLHAAATQRVGAPLVRLLQRLVFFQLVTLGWALFRAQSLADCATLWSKMLSAQVWRELPAFWHKLIHSGQAQYVLVRATEGDEPWRSGLIYASEAHFVLGMMLVGLLLLIGQWRWPHEASRLIERVWRGPIALRLAFVLGLIYAAALLAPETPPPFIYFQF